MIFIYYFAIFILLIIFVLFVYEFYLIFFRGFAPFVPTRKKVLKKIIKEVDIKEDSVIMELGCGTAVFLKNIRKFYPKIRLIGIEHSPILYIASYIQNKLRNNNIEIIKQDFFDTNISNVDIIYCYLNVETMKNLESKFEHECKSGAIVVSFTFSLPNIKPEKEFEVSFFKEKIFIYHF